MLFSINKKKDFHNASILLERKDGQSLYAENGELKLTEFSTALSEPETGELNRLITSLLKRVKVGNGALSSSNVRSFVFEKIFPLHPSICNPSALQKNPAIRSVIAERVKELTPEVANDFNIIRCTKRIQQTKKRMSEIQKLRFNSVRGLLNICSRIFGGRADRSLEKEWVFLKWRKKSDEKYRAALSEALLGLKMNLNHETSCEKDGWSGSYFWRSFLTNRKIGIYKPCDQDSISSGSPRLLARLRFNLIPKSNGVIVSQSGKSHIAEAGASIAATIFHRAYLAMKVEGFKIPFKEADPLVPDTRIVEVHDSSGPTEPGIGSFQLFLQRSTPLSVALGIDKLTFQPLGKRMKDQEILQLLPQYQWLKLFHFLIFSQDDHAENTLAIRNSEGEIIALKAIDNGQSFPAVPLERGFIENTVFSMKPMFGLRHPLGNEKILPFFREFLRRFSEDGYLDQLAKELYDLYQNPINYPEGKAEEPEITAGRIFLLKERYRVLNRLFVKQTQPLQALLHYAKGDSLYDTADSFS